MHEYHRFSSRNLGKIHKVFTECGKACGSRYKLSPELGLQYENIDIPAVLKETECQVKQFWLGLDVLVDTVRKGHFPRQRGHGVWTAYVR